MCIKHSRNKQYGFTLVELLVGISIVAILTAVALPSLNRFVVNMRVDSQISELHRLLLIARNTAVNSGRDVVICPIINDSCTNDWTQEISVFIDFNQNNDYDLAAGDNPTDEIVRVKSAINNNKDKFQYTGGASLTYNSLGNLPSNNSEFIFSYCPDGFTDESRGISVSISGRAFISQDSNDDGFDEDRNNIKITCS